MNRWLVTGAGGMLGQDVVASLERDGETVLALTRRDLDITDQAAVTATVLGCRPDIVVNCAAWTAVDEAEAHDVAEHLRTCPTCRAAHERVLALRTALEQHAPPLAAPDRLRATIRSRLETAGSASRRPVSWRWLAAAAALVAVIGGTWQVAATVSAGRALADQVLASHVRSLMPGHLTDVASTDQHTVKPWFNGRLD